MGVKRGEKDFILESSSLSFYVTLWDNCNRNKDDFLLLYYIYMLLSLSFFNKTIKSA